MSTPPPTNAARIVDRGYQHYRGARLGTAHALSTMVIAAVGRCLGLRRSLRAKILPWLLLLAAFAPTLVLLGLHILTASSGIAVQPSYGTLYSGLDILYILFAATVAPDLLSLDRRERVLALLFTAPITRLHYLAAQVLGLIIPLTVMTLAPMLLLFTGDVVLAPQAGSYLGDHLGDLGHILAAGTLLAVYYAAVASLITAFTDGRAYATGAFLGLLLVSGVAIGVLISIVGLAGHEWLQLLLLATLPLRCTTLLFASVSHDPIGVGGYLAATLAVIAVSLALAAWRYLAVYDV